VHGQPAEHHRGNAGGELQRRAVLTFADHNEQRHHRHDHRAQHHQQDEGRRLVFLGRAGLEEFDVHLPGGGERRHQIDQEKHVGSACNGDIARKRRGDAAGDQPQQHRNVEVAMP